MVVSGLISRVIVEHPLQDFPLRRAMLSDLEVTILRMEWGGRIIRGSLICSAGQLVNLNWLEI